MKTHYNLGITFKSNKNIIYKKKNTKSKDDNKKRKSKKKKNRKSKSQNGGTPKKINIDFGIITYQTLGDCIKELIEASYKIYHFIINDIFKILGKVTIVCGGQSPAYYCLAMMKFKIYDAKKAKIIILPHSKGGQKSENQIEENELYSQRLEEKNIQLEKNIVIIDGVHTGTGILALESALKYFFNKKNGKLPNKIYKIAINAQEDISEIPVDFEYILPCEPKFSDTFPRLVESYKPSDFRNSSKFKNYFNIQNNPVADMIIDLSSNYHPSYRIEDSEWYKKNNNLTPQIIELQKEKKRLQKIKLEQEKGGIFKPIILQNAKGGKIYKCPICKSETGTLAVKYPNVLSYFPHNFDCPNKNKIPVE